ncbi:MAG: D-alanyl-D-alanine carboxypeptidase [Saprospiraceae bacterium]|jgi:D-alanyl-D-alanine carboxypeptidase
MSIAMNTNYWILGRLIERVSNQTITAYAKEHIFDPLGMNSTTYLETKGKVVPNRVSGYVSECPDCDRLEYRAQSEAVGDGGVVSNINDLLLWEK